MVGILMLAAEAILSIVMLTVLALGPRNAPGETAALPLRNTKQCAGVHGKGFPGPVIHVDNRLASTLRAIILRSHLRYNCISARPHRLFDIHSNHNILSPMVGMEMCPAGKAIVGRAPYPPLSGRYGNLPYRQSDCRTNFLPAVQSFGAQHGLCRIYARRLCNQYR